MDSVQFMNASLDTLITNLNQSRGLLRVQHLIKHTEVTKVSVITQESVLLMAQGVWGSVEKAY